MTRDGDNKSALGRSPGRLVIPEAVAPAWAASILDTYPRPPTADAVAAFFHPDSTVGPGLAPGLLTCPALVRRTPLAGLVPHGPYRRSGITPCPEGSIFTIPGTDASGKSATVYEFAPATAVAWETTGTAVPGCTFRPQSEALSKRMHRPWLISHVPWIAREEHILTDVLDPIEV